jgi:hypothetical protein
MGDFNINLLNVATHQKTNDFIDNVSLIFNLCI